MNWTRGRTLGRGSSATVSIARASQSGEVFAVKSAELSKSEFLQRERRILSSLKCPQIVTYIGHDVTQEEDGELMYNLFMEYISGGTLSEAIHNQGGRLHESSIRSYTTEILNGLSYLHSNRLVHCDIKGRNVLIGREGAKIADLGCARLDSEVSGIAGTPVYMAPEVARGEEQSFPADVWALGCTVIEMATGRPPWPDVSDPVSAVYKIAFSDDVPEFPCWLSQEAQDFLGKCLRRNSEERWTVNQLLKHPFLVDPKRIQSPESSSPTTILDQGFWDSLEEEEQEEKATPRDLSSTSASSSVSQRLRRVSCSRAPDWTWEEDWVTIRSSSDEGSENSSNRDHNMTTYLEDLEEETELHGCSVLDSVSNINLLKHDSCSSRRIFPRDCTCRCCLPCNLNFELQRDYIIFNSNSILLKP